MSLMPGNRPGLWRIAFEVGAGVLLVGASIGCQPSDSQLPTDGGLIVEQQGQQSAAYCVADADCATGFCDRERCATATPPQDIPNLDYFYGRECVRPVNPLITLAGTEDSPPYCNGYMCLDGRCRSCTSGQECYESQGLLACSPSSGRPGKQCTAYPAAGESLYVPPALPIRVGRRLLPVPSEVDAPSSLVVTLTGTTVPVHARLAVVYWHQRSGIPDEYTQIAYDVPLEGSDQVEIALEHLALPYEENILCFRNCTDRAACDCNAMVGLALANVLVAVDANQDGKLSVDEIRREQLGATAAFIGWSATHQENVVQGFPTGGPILQGFDVYYKPGSLALAAAHGTSYAVELPVCEPGDTACSFPTNHLYCLSECDRDWGLNRLGL